MRIMHIKRTIRAWCNKFMDLFFESTNQFRNLNIINELIPLSSSGWKKECWKYSDLALSKVMLLCFLVVRFDKTLGIISKRKNKPNF